MKNDCETTPEYWDCECPTHFIHIRAVDTCSRCGSSREDSPDARVAEVGLPSAMAYNQP